MRSVLGRILPFIVARAADLWMAADNSRAVDNAHRGNGISGELRSVETSDLPPYPTQFLTLSPKVVVDHSKRRN